MAKNLTPQQVAEKHARRTKGAQQDMIAGVNAVAVNPAEKAVAKEQKLVSNWNAAIQSGKWSRGMKRVTLDGWKKSMIEKGAGRVAAGIDASIDKTTEFFAQLLPFQADLVAKIDKMPDLTIEDSVARSAEFIRGMSKFKRSRGS